MLCMCVAETSTKRMKAVVKSHKQVSLPSVLREVKARDQSAQISGYLLYSSSKARRWKKRWFVVYNLVLYEFERHEVSCIQAGYDTCNMYLCLFIYEHVLVSVYTCNMFLCLYIHATCTCVCLYMQHVLVSLYTCNMFLCLYIHATCSCVCIYMQHVLVSVYICNMCLCLYIHATCSCACVYIHVACVCVCIYTCNMC